MYGASGPRDSTALTQDAGHATHEAGHAMPGVRAEGLRPARHRDAGDRRRLSAVGWIERLGGDAGAWRGRRPHQLSREEQRELARCLLLAFVAARGGDPGMLAPSRMNADADGRRIRKLLAQRQSADRLGGSTLAELVEEVSGRPRSALLLRRTGGKSRFPPHAQHLAADRSSPEPHPGLMSLTELAVDVLLASVVGPEWPGRHRHHVPLRELGTPLHHNFSVDVMIVSRGGLVSALEIGGGAELHDDLYRARRAIKRRALEALRIPLHECDLPGTGAGNLEALRKCAEWVAFAALHERVRVSDSDVLHAMDAAAGTAALVSMDLAELHAWLRRHDLFGQPCEAYLRARERLLSVDPETRRTPPRGSIQRWMRAQGVSDRFQMMGRIPVGKGSGKAKSMMPSYELFEDYEVAREVARAGRFANVADYLRRHKDHDPRLPSNPAEAFPDELARDGWPGYLGTGPARAEIGGLVRAAKARRVLKLGYARFQQLVAPLKETAVRYERADGAAYLYDPARLVQQAVRHGVLAAESVASTLRALSRVAERA